MGTTNAAQPVTIPMLRDRETKNTVRYAESVGDDETARTIYVPKEDVAKLGNPDAIEVTIAPK